MCGSLNGKAMYVFIILVFVLLANEDVNARPAIRIALEDPFGTNGVGSSLFNSLLEIQLSAPLICIVSHEFTCAKESKFDLFNKDMSEVIITKECVITERYNNNLRNKSYYQILHVGQQNSSVLQAALSSNLQCRYHDGNGNVQTSDNTIRLPFLPCDMTSDTCLETQCPNTGDQSKKYCIVTKTGIEQCSNLMTMELCENEYKYTRFCPVDELGVCRALVRNHTAVWFETKADHACPNISNVHPPLKLNGKAYMHNEPVPAKGRSHLILEFDCETGFSGAGYSLRINEDIFVVPQETSQEKCEGQIRKILTRNNNPRLGFGLSDLIHSFGVFDTSLEFRVMETEFKYRVVVFDAQLNLTVDKGQLKCMLVKPASIYFIARIWWTKESSGSRRLSEKAISNRVLSDETSTWGMDHRDMRAHRNDTYQCHMKISFKTCVPYRELSEEFHSDQVEYFYNSATRLQLSLEIAIFTFLAMFY